jgi:hypothetical protein
MYLLATFARLRPFLPLLVLSLLACDSPLEVQACPENSQWGTAGCAVLFVVLHEPEQVPAGSYALSVSARLDGGGPLAHAPEPRFGRFLMTIDLGPFPPVSVEHPVDIWVTARLIKPGAGSGPNTVYLAQDSVRTSVAFVPARTLPTADTVVLRPK